jgi:asparagine synthetase A
MKLAKWKREALGRIRRWSNDKLLTEAFDLAPGDDYDGCFTDRGEWEFAAMNAELDCRLWLSGWLKESPFLKWGKR